MSLNTYPYNPFPASTDKLDETHNAELQLEVDQLKEDVEKLETDKTDTAVMAPAFDTETGVYAVGDLVMYQGKLYEFTSAHETAGDWDTTEVTEKTVADEIGDVKSGLTNLTVGNVIKTDPNNIIYSVYSDIVQKKAGIKFFVIAFSLNKIQPIGTYSELFTIPENFKPMRTVSQLYITSEDKYVQIQFNSDGTINLFTNDTHPNGGTVAAYIAII